MVIHAFVHGCRVHRFSRPLRRLFALLGRIALGFATMVCNPTDFRVVLDRLRFVLFHPDVGLVRLLASKSRMVVR